MNTTTITGNLSREPEVRYTREGRACTQLGVAVTEREEIPEGSPVESTGHFEVVVWDDLAENVALSLCKGMGVIVTGRLGFRTWETDEGEHRSKVEIVASDVGPSLCFATADVMKVRRNIPV